MPKSNFGASLAALTLLLSPAAGRAQLLAGAPEGYGASPNASAAPGYDDGPYEEAAPPHRRHAPWREAGSMPASERSKACYAQVHMAAAYGPPPTGPEYVWRQAPAPPGAPGPVWCLTVQALPRRPVLISPERLGWIRVLCADQVTPARVAEMQQRLYGQGLYGGGFDGRYDAATSAAVTRFQQARHFDDGGYLSYRTWGALQALPPPRYAGPGPTTFDTGVLDWAGKTRG